MTQNPFEAPKARELQSTPALSGTGRFEIGQCLSEGWERVSQNLGLMIGATLVGGICFILAEVTIIGLFVVVPVLLWGGVKFYLEVYDGRGELGDLFSGFRSYGAALGSVLLLGVCIIAMYIPAYAVIGIGAVLESSAVAGIGNLLALVVAFGVILRFYFAIFFIVDQQMGAIDALKASWNATQEQKLSVLLLALLSGVIAAAGLLALGIGMLVSIPVSYMMFASAYRQMVGTPNT